MLAESDERLYFCTRINKNRKILKHYTRICLLALLFLLSPSVVSAYTEAEEKMLEMFRQFRELYEQDSEEEFYQLAHEYEGYLLANNRKTDFYKIKCNEGFYDVRHQHNYRAMKTAKELDEVMRKNGDSEYYYLATGLFGDVYRASFDGPKARKYYLQALEEVGDRDPKFTMTTYLHLADLLNLKDPKKALDYADKAIQMAKKADNIEFLSLSIAYKAFVTFLSNADPKEFNLLYERYDYLKNQNDPDFNHRYDQIMEVAKAAYDGKYNEALDLVKNGKVNVDSALTVVRIYGLSGDMNNTFEAMSRLYSDLDSVFSITQNANFDELTTERQLVLSQEEAAINKKLVKRMTNWFIILVLIFLIVYIMGRRRLVRKIWVKNKELKDALDKAEEGARMKSRLISGIGRELRTPLNVVAGFSQVLSSPDFNPTEKERQDMHQRIMENVDKINSAIDRLVELSDDKEE